MKTLKVSNLVGQINNLNETRTSLSESQKFHFLVDHIVGSKIAQCIDPRDKIVFESCPGPGVLSRELLRHSPNHLISFGHLSAWESELKDISSSLPKESPTQFQYFPENLLDIQLTEYSLHIPPLLPSSNMIFTGLLPESSGVDLLVKLFSSYSQKSGIFRSNQFQTSIFLPFGQSLTNQLFAQPLTTEELKEYLFVKQRENLCPKDLEDLPFFKNLFYSRFTTLSSHFSTKSNVFSVPRASFYPKFPEDLEIIRFQIHSHTDDIPNIPHFSQLIYKIFTNKTKTIRDSIAASFPDLEPLQICEKSQIHPDTMMGTIPLDKWRDIGFEVISALLTEKQKIVKPKLKSDISLPASPLLGSKPKATQNDDSDELINDLSILAHTNESFDAMLTLSSLEPKRPPHSDPKDTFKLDTDIQNLEEDLESQDSKPPSINSNPLLDQLSHFQKEFMDDDVSAVDIHEMLMKSTTNQDQSDSPQEGDDPNVSQEQFAQFLNTSGLNSIPQKTYKDASSSDIVNMRNIILSTFPQEDLEKALKLGKQFEHGQISHSNKDLQKVRKMINDPKWIPSSQPIPFETTSQDSSKAKKQTPSLPLQELFQNPKSESSFDFPEFQSLNDSQKEWVNELDNLEFNK